MEPSGDRAPLVLLPEIEERVHLDGGSEKYWGEWRVACVVRLLILLLSSLLLGGGGAEGSPLAPLIL